MATVSENVYFDVLHDIVNKCSRTYHRTINMKPIGVKSDSYAEYNVSSNEKDSISNAVDHVIIQKFKNIFAKGYAPNWSGEVFVIMLIKKYRSLDLCY